MESSPAQETALRDYREAELDPATIGNYLSRLQDRCSVIDEAVARLGGILEPVSGESELAPSSPEVRRLVPRSPIAKTLDELVGRLGQIAGTIDYIARRVDL